MYFLKDKRSGNITITIFLMILLSWISTITCFILKKEYEKCFILQNKKEINNKAILCEYYKQYLEKHMGAEYIIKKDGEIIWNLNIKQSEPETDNGFIIKKISKNNKVIYDIDEKNNNNYKSIIKNFSDYNQTNKITVIFIKKYYKGSIGKETSDNLEIETHINSSYVYDRDLDITKNLDLEIGAVYVKKGFEGSSLYRVF